jgi:hypothetical protein
MTSTDSTPEDVQISTAEQHKQREQEAEATLSSIAAGPDFDPADPKPWERAAELMNTDPEFCARMLEAEFTLQRSGQTAEEYAADGSEPIDDAEYGIPHYTEELIETYTARARAARRLPLLLSALDTWTRAEMSEEFHYEVAPTSIWELITFDCSYCSNPIRVSARSGGTGMGFQVTHANTAEHRKTKCRKDGNALLKLIGLGGLTSAQENTFDPSFLDDEEAEVPEPEWLIDGMFCRGDYWSLFGPSEVGKSLLALDWALQMARKGVRVLYLDMENPMHVLKARFKKMGAKYEDFVNLRLESFPQMGDLALESGAKQLHEKVEKHGAEVIILDTISKFSQTGQATHSDRWQKMYNESFKPLLAKGLSIGQLDHTGLSDKHRERDSSAKRDNVSVAWALTWRGKDRLTLTRAKNRPNYPSSGSIAVERVDEPLLTHRFGESVPDDIRKALEELDRLGVPARAGRPAARAVLEAAGVQMADKVLEQAIRTRKAA